MTPGLFSRLCTPFLIYDISYKESFGDTERMFSWKIIR